MGVSCSPWMIPVMSKRWRVEGAMASAAAAFLMVDSRPSCAGRLGSRAGDIPMAAQIADAARLEAMAICRECALERLRMPAITASG